MPDKPISTYIINLKERTERRCHSEAEFGGKAEFNIRFIDAVKHPNGAVGLWQSIVQAVKISVERNDDVMIICEDDHLFTPHYTKEHLFAAIDNARKKRAELLLGGIGNFGFAVPAAADCYWVDWFWSTQFTIIFKPLFETIIGYDFKNSDTADVLLSRIVTEKYVMYPFISIQKDFGYSDVTSANNEKVTQIVDLFVKSDLRLKKLHRISTKLNTLPKGLRVVTNAMWSLFRLFISAKQKYIIPFVLFMRRVQYNLSKKQ